MQNKKLIRIIAIVLAVLLAGGVVVGALLSAMAEQQTEVGNPGPHQCELKMEYLDDEQALHITQRLVYINHCGHPLEAVVFYGVGNLFRRQSALTADDGDWDRMFFAGYLPAGIELRSVRCNEKQTDFGFQSEDEIYLRVDCDVPSGGQCVFEFEYYLLLMRCGAFQGVGDNDVRLSAFCFVPGVYDASTGQFNMKKPLAHTRWLYCEAADYRVELTLPTGWLLCASGAVEKASEADGRVLWRVEAEGVRDFALSFGRRWREAEGETASNVRVRALTNVRGAAGRMLDTAISAIGQCETWFGAFPVETLTLAQSDIALGTRVFTGVVWLPTDLLSSGRADELAQRIRFAVAQQYFGLSAYVEPSSDAWLSDSLCEYIACLLLEAASGRDRFLAYVNRDWVSALQQTVPGGLRITSDAALFDAATYDLVVRQRGAVVLHELRLAMGLDDLLAGFKRFYGMGEDGRTLTEKDFVSALDQASGESWEAFLTDWLFNVGDYVEQDMTWYE